LRSICATCSPENALVGPARGRAHTRQRVRVSATASRHLPRHGDLAPSMIQPTVLPPNASGGAQQAQSDERLPAGPEVPPEADLCARAELNLSCTASPGDAQPLVNVALTRSNSAFEGFPEAYSSEQEWALLGSYVVHMLCKIRGLVVTGGGCWARRVVASWCSVGEGSAGSIGTPTPEHRTFSAMPVGRRTRSVG